jgi:hypothetical protein
MPISINDLRDLLATTLKDNPIDGKYQSTLPYQQYEAVSRWFAKDRKKSDGGTSYQRNIVLTEAGTASHITPYETVEYNQTEGQAQINMPWNIIRGHWLADRFEIMANAGRAKIIPFLDSKRKEGLKSFYTLLEQRAWRTPDSATDVRNPAGLSYWLTKMTSATKATLGAGAQRGFYGYNPVYGDGTTAASTGGIDASSTSTVAGAQNWRNWTAAYPNSVFDLAAAREMKWAFLKLMFSPPEQLSDLGVGGSANKYRIYMNDETIVAYEELAQAQNDNLGADLQPFQGVTTFRKIPVKYAPLLDSDTSDPIYLVNHDHFYPVIRDGEWEREEEPMTDQATPTVLTVNIFGYYLIFCDNRREAGAVISKVA